MYDIIGLLKNKPMGILISIGIVERITLPTITQNIIAQHIIKMWETIMYYKIFSLKNYKLKYIKKNK